jgi:hypothetical protein
MRKVRAIARKNDLFALGMFCFVRGSPRLKKTEVKFFAESKDMSYKDMIDALTKL